VKFYSNVLVFFKLIYIFAV